MKSPSVHFLSLCVPLFSVTAVNSDAANVATWQNSGNVTYLNSAISAAGQTPVTISALNSAGLSGVSVLFLLNSDNFGYSTSMTDGASDLAGFVNGGGTLIFFDRTAGNANTTLNSILPGAYVFNIARSTVPDLDLSLPGHPSLAGLTDASFDGGSSAAHGHILAGDLPLGATSFIHVQGNPNQIVDFSYSFGAGTVRYSSIPADFYASGAGSVSFQNAVSQYAQNLVAVPEPSTPLLSAIAMIGLMARRRRG